MEDEKDNNKRPLGAMSPEEIAASVERNEKFSSVIERVEAQKDDSTFDAMSSVFEAINENIENLVSGILGRSMSPMGQIEIDMERTSVLETILEHIKATEETMWSAAEYLKDLLGYSEKQAKMAEEMSEAERRRRDFDKHKDDPNPTVPDIAVDTTSFDAFDDIIPSSLTELLRNVGIGGFTIAFVKGAINELFDTEISFKDIVDVGRMKEIFQLVKFSISRLFAPVAGLSRYIGSLQQPWSQMFSGISSSFSKTGVILAKIFKPLTTFTKGVQNFITTPAWKTIQAFAKFSGAGAVVKMLGKVAWPISIIMGLYDGVNAFQEKEGNLIEKTLSGVGAMLASIIGEPLDLLKRAVGYILGKLGWDSAEALLAEFSFSDLITGFFDGVYGFASDAFSWLGTLFTDPRAALTQLWNNLFDGASFASKIFDSAVKPFMDWIDGFFSDPSGTLNSNVSAWIGAYATFAGWLTGKVVDPILGWFGKLFGWVEPDTDFSIEKVIEDNVLKPFSTWLNDAFNNPVEKITKLMADMLKGYGSFSLWLSDLVFSPIFTWIGKAFGWLEPDEDFSLQETFDGVVQDIKDWFKELFDFLPNVQEVKDMLINLLPVWMRPKSVAEQREKITRDMNEDMEFEDAKVARAEADVEAAKKDEQATMQSILDEIALHKSKIDEGDDRYGLANALSRENRISELKEDLANTSENSNVQYYQDELEAVKRDKEEKLKEYERQLEDLADPMGEAAVDVRPTPMMDVVMKPTASEPAVDAGKKLLDGLDTYMMNMDTPNSVSAKTERLIEKGEAALTQPQSVFVQGATNNLQPITHNNRGGDTIIKTTNYNDPAKALGHEPQ